ncbi:MFS transporter [Burkholderia glumae]|uniref:MFS transporter n=1 Tax=Burkholderia glumae TaxID=337 RepID=A0AAP9XX28_BURGL|nr:MFS transporter [Burkholderia glumae]ACR31306.1 Major facilitator superfamily transporter [Burkholderia glumae BGR1]AJY63285.1 major Facilitator Superfamily protein [Burkholderia glumae LMG 2196 = ATCC 33617]MCM2485541.1 MFS transporter [Burkholderia glumae]MCM2495947.1 MFS transporter [Burkholderia glumae]MCM2511236.1 MFS transporter [Burkholderia glumae]
MSANHLQSLRVPHQDGLPTNQRIAALIAISLAVAMATLDTAITNTALPTIAASIGADHASVIWVVNAYQLAMVATLLPFASLGEIAGHRRVYIAGLALFSASSLACGLAWSLPTLATARALQGVGAAAIMSVNTALVRFSYPARLLGRGVGLNALVVAVSFTVGPTVASAILSVTTWHWLFLVNVPVGLAAIAMAAGTLPVTQRARHGFDMAAALLCAIFFAFLILGLGTIAHDGMTHTVIAEWVIAALGGYALLRRQASHPAPMLAVDLFRRPVFSLSALTSVCSFATQGCAFVSLPFFLQIGLGNSQVATGFLMTPWPAVVAVMAPIAGRLSDRYPAGVLGSVGLLALAIGMASLATLPPAPSSFALVWRMALCGAGFGFFQAPNLKALMGSAPPRRSGAASGIVATARLLGQTLGAALVALCFHAAGTHGPIVALWTGSGFALMGTVVSCFRLLPYRRQA